MSKEIKIDLEVHKLIESARQGFDQSENVILRSILGLDGAKSPPNAPAPPTPVGYEITINGDVLQSTSLNDVYYQALKRLSAQNTTFCQELAKVNYPRGKVVAKHKTELFRNSPHLRRNFARSLGNGYLADVNLSSVGAKSRLRHIAKTMGKLRMGTISASW